MEKKAISYIAAAMLASSAFGMEFQPLGFESISMGGAGVASAKGSMAGYYNPALLAKSPNVVEISLGGGVGIRENNLADNLDTLNKAEFIDTLDRIANNAPVSGSNSDTDKKNIQLSLDTLKKIGDENGLALMPTAFFSAQIKNYALGVFGFGEGTATAVIDRNRLDLIVEDNGNYYKYDPVNDIYSTTDYNDYVNNSIEYAVNNGTTYLKLTGLSVVEVPISYAQSYNINKIGELSIGLSLKYMQGITYNGSVSIDTKSGDVNDNLDNADKTSSSFGVDLGMLYIPEKLSDLTIGVVGKNLNSPEFDTIDPNVSYTVDPQVRMGIAYTGISSLDIALDVDLTENETFIKGFDSRYIGGGFNWHPTSWFSLRAGLMDNLSDSTEGVIYTAGLGFGLKWFSFDISAQLSSKNGYYDGEEIPKYAKVNFALVSRF